MSNPDSHALRALLLHGLSEAEARALEERLMQEDGFLEAVQDAEHDLLDDYARGRLNDEERASVERHLLATPEARQRLEVTRSLARARGDSSSSRLVALPHRRHRRTWAVALAAAASLVIVALVMPFRFGTDLTKRTEILLLAENQRGTPTQPIEIDEAATEVRLQVEIPVASQTATYGVEIMDSQGRSVHAANDLRVHDVSGYSVVDLIVPGRAFAAGPGIVILRELQQANPSATPVEVFRWQVQVNRR